MPLYPVTRHKSYGTLCLIGETKSWANDTEAVPQMYLSKKCSAEMLQIDESSHAAVWSQQSFIATLLKFTSARVLPQRTATY